MEMTLREMKELVNSIETQTNRSPYRRNPFHSTIDHLRVYFYYFTEITVDTEPPVKLYKYNHPHPIWNMQAARRVVEDLAQNAYEGGDYPEQYGDKWDFEPWRKVSLIAIVLHRPPWRFISEHAIAFLEEGQKKGNHTFFDAFDFDFKIRTDQGPSDASALCFTNHMVDAYGNPLADGQREEFKYNLCATDGTKARSADIDPGGTNLGPPVPPP